MSLMWGNNDNYDHWRRHENIDPWDDSDAFMWIVVVCCVIGAICIEVFCK